MKEKGFGIFRRMVILVFSLISILGFLFIIITYLATTHYHKASTQLLNKDIAAHIAEFTSPFNKNGFNKSKADSVFHHAMVINPSVEVYFLDTAGTVIAFNSPPNEVLLKTIPVENIKKYIAAQGQKYITAPDPKAPAESKIFSAAEVIDNKRNLGYIYVILGSNRSQDIMNMILGAHISNLAITVFVAIILLSVIISIFSLSSIQKSFKRMIDVLRRFEGGDYSARFVTKEKDDLAPVTQAFNKMADLLSYNINSLTKSEQDRKDFIAIISHDLRTPLSIARGYAETLLIKKESDEITPPQQNDYILLILQKIHQVEIMVQQLFELSKIDAAEFKPNMEPFVLSEIVQEIINTFQLRAYEKNISLRCTECQYHVWVNADIGMTERVVQNLIDNALKSTPAGGSIQISIQVDNKQLMFSIANEGSALPDDLLLWINNAGGDKSLLKKRPAKLGLGLLIVQKMLMLHGSFLEAYTHEGSRNIFLFSLPIYNTSPGN